MDQNEKFRQFAEAMPAMANDPQSVRQRVEAMELLLERSFHIPGTKIPVGLDSIIGLIPVLGDLITAAMGAYMVWEARNLGMSKFQLTRMAANVGIDTVLGAIPFIGDAFDLLWRSNSKNLRIIKKHLDKHHPHTKIIDA
ncbi:hypothetical protein LPB140_02370 [Sphingorhabdus lutea]|uniref:DUF4112 domain-containing protein n=1 Tax=Sphingorhabdus lutea TaxID=1913578 RepID=A0A1L3JEL4_9SPHN|nr:DUF4112 domain-containing protein [Sphingorhabdus lutea]APG63493.1 hypothetical protein LPB140_02370 [Sphingorhabdus lutea]